MARKILYLLTVEPGKSLSLFMFLENNSTFIVLCVLSVITLITGFWFYFNSPKQINMFYGYRTKSSMKSQKHWDFAHSYSGKLFIVFGIILLVSAISTFLLNFNNDIGNFAAVILFIIGTFFIIIKTEIAINKLDKRGSDSKRKFRKK